MSEWDIEEGETYLTPFGHWLYMWAGRLGLRHDICMSWDRWWWWRKKWKP